MHVFNWNISVVWNRKTVVSWNLYGIQIVGVSSLGKFLKPRQEIFQIIFWEIHGGELTAFLFPATSPHAWGWFCMMQHSSLLRWEARKSLGAGTAKALKTSPTCPVKTQISEPRDNRQECSTQTDHHRGFHGGILRG